MGNSHNRVNLTRKEQKKESHIFVTLFFLVIRLGLEPRTPTLKVLCSTC